MIDLCISGILDEDLSGDFLVFSIDGESKTIDRFSGQVHFSLEKNKAYRLYFEQKSEQAIPRFAENILDVLFLPVRGILNAVTFNTSPTWWKDISAFKISGYIDIDLNENAEISFELKSGSFDKNTDMFCPPVISFSRGISTEQSCIPDFHGITKAHHNHLLNIASTSVLLLALLFYLLHVGAKNEMNVACVITTALIISFVILTAWLILHSFKKRDSLIIALAGQQNKKAINDN